MDFKNKETEEKLEGLFNKLFDYKPLNEEDKQEGLAAVKRQVDQCMILIPGISEFHAWYASYVGLIAISACWAEAVSVVDTDLNAMFKFAQRSKRTMEIINAVGKHMEEKFSFNTREAAERFKKQQGK